MSMNILITGASKGLGRAVARVAARDKHNLIINARSEDELRDAERELASMTQVLAVPGDVSDIAEDIAALAISRFGPVDVLVNNASELGPSPMPQVLDHSWQSLERVFRVNVVAPIHLIQLVRPRTIINITSDAGVNAYRGWGGYGASKAALEHISRVLAAEVEGSGVRVFVVDPGDMNTEMHRLAEPGIDLSHLPRPEDVAPAIVDLFDDPRPFARIEAQKIEVMS